MKVLDFPELPSTQTYLIENLPALLREDSEVLVKTSKQTQGHGRHSKTWEYLEGSLAFSCVLEPHEVNSLSPLEVSVLLTEFLRQKLQQDLFVKWPNDLLDQDGKKYGGIICQLKLKKVVAGIGLNFSSTDLTGEVDFPHRIFSLSRLNFTEEELYQYLLENRLSAEELKLRWNQLCFHLKKEVTISDSDFQCKGLFKGLGEFGQAILETDQGEKELFSGTLRFH